MAAGKSSEVGWPDQVIIAIDIDCFYVACERLLDPSLIGKPIGVQQKYILATSSYEARAFGVQKLQSVKDAKRACPELILINGEDLTYYRRFSRGVTRLVKSIVWGRKVERLGMDELFCDVTDMVRRHVDNAQARKDLSDTKTFFDLSHPRSATAAKIVDTTADSGFWYDSTVSPSLVIPADTSVDAKHSELLSAAAQLAAHIRSRIHAELGFTTSAGIAHNKIIAKLVGNLNKPALQTLWTPDIRHFRQFQADFLADFEAGKIQGFGHAILSSLRERLDAKTAPDPDRALTVNTLRTGLAASDFTKLFGAKAGTRLWEMLWGDDVDPVVPSPEYPVQISVENSHYGITHIKQAIEELGGLAHHLLLRLQEDLTESPDDIPLPAPGGVLKPYFTSTKEMPLRPWVHYPSILRLTIRQGYDRQRESTTVAFPVDAIDETLPVDVRAAKLVNGVLTSMLKRLLKTTSNDVQCRITILNVCATNFTPSRPNPSLSTIFKARTIPDGGKDSSAKEEVDLTVLTSPEVRKLDPVHALPESAHLLISDDEEEGDNDILFVHEHKSDYITCDVCSSRVFTFALAAHKAYHTSAEKPSNTVTKQNTQPKKRRRVSK